MENKFRIVFLFLFLLSHSPLAFPQIPQESRTYFPRNYSNQPVITFKEGFLNKMTYYLDGDVVNSKEVAALFDTVQNEDFKFLANHRKKQWGTRINLTGLAVNIGSIVYLFTNEIHPGNVATWYFVTLGGGILQGTGKAIIDNAERRIEQSINDFNAYHYSGGPTKFLSMGVSDTFLGEKIGIYEGPMFLENDEVLSRMKSNEEAYQLFEQILKRQRVSKLTNITNSALGIGIFFLAVGFQTQS
jgi:hypothetical protein